MDSTHRATPDEILRAIVKRLRESIPEYTSTSCIVTDQPIPFTWPTTDVMATVCFGAISFPEHFFSGGGYLTCCADAQLLVTPYVRNKLDMPGSGEQALLNAPRSLFGRYVHLILESLLVDNRSGSAVAWEPVGDDSSPLLRDQLSPLGISPASKIPQTDCVGLTMTFRTCWDWRL